MKYPIEINLDSSGEEVKIYFQDNLTGCPALSLFLKVYAEIIDKKYCHPSVVWSNKSSMVWAEKNGKVVGGICFEYNSENRIGWIILSFTEELERGKRINQILQNVFEKIIKQNGGERIGSLVHIDNISRQKSAERVGLKPVFYRMEKNLK
jgi:hypothetical protein